MLRVPVPCLPALTDHNLGTGTKQTLSPLGSLSQQQKLRGTQGHRGSLLRRNMLTANNWIPASPNGSAVAVPCLDVISLVPEYINVIDKLVS